MGLEKVFFLEKCVCSCLQFCSGELIFVQLSECSEEKSVLSTQYIFRSYIKYLLNLEGSVKICDENDVTLFPFGLYVLIMLFTSGLVKLRRRFLDAEQLSAFPLSISNLIC